MVVKSTHDIILTFLYCIQFVEYSYPVLHMYLILPMRQSIKCVPDDVSIVNFFRGICYHKFNNH